jgi:hypothetical protein
MQGNSCVTVEGIRLQGSEAVKQTAALDDMQAHSLFRGEDTQNDIIGRDHISQCGGWVF